MSRVRTGSMSLLSFWTAASHVALLTATIMGLALGAMYVGSVLVVPMRLTFVQPWSFALGQVAFGLSAALLAIILPQLVQFREWWDIWVDRLAEREPVVSDAVFIALGRLIEQAPVKARLKVQEYSVLTRRLAVWSKKGKDQHFAHVLDCARALRTLLRRKAMWEHILQATSLSQDLSLGVGSQFRQIYLVELYAFDLRSLYRRMCVQTISLCVITLLLGALSLTPDPFFYGNIMSILLDKDPQIEKTVYPMFALLLPAMLILFAMAWLGYRASMTYGSLRQLDPHLFDAEFHVAGRPQTLADNSP